MQNTQKIITRFAPSPTGFLHIGGARTALFNYLFAKHHGGAFKLRIEDTDRERSTPEAVAAILEGLTWLGLEWDGEAVSQYDNAPRHHAVVDELIARGKAFKCYCSPDEVEALRETAFAEGRALRSPWRDRDPSEAPADAPYVVRFRASDEGVTLHDAVQGEVKWAAKEFDDLVLLRADGNPTYNLAVVVDDHDMGVTHIIRGDDHLVNGARQAQIYAALDWDLPQFAHIPLIHGPDGKKLSKRHGALGVEAYRDMGYLPEGMRNYLLRLGWAHGDQELFSDDEMVQAFSLSGLNKAPGRLDFDKMAHVNAHHMRLADDQRLFDLLMAHLADRDDLRLDEITKAWVLRAMPILKARAKTIPELADQAEFMLKPRPFVLTGKLAKPLQDDGAQRMARLRAVFADHQDWSEDALSEALKTFAEAEEVGFGKIGQPLRACLTGGSPAPDMGIVLAILGQDETLARLDDQLNSSPGTGQ
ncbi:glutamate--tRNA ligase [Woodsholea maritima]|uniref:glutamate--tRNA ligase n=1 Tax=Woodsholea maritima TaxID=240237 RepID=UPI00039C7036|nr:glutamate--tRNA ligase [Woodsholea maritima]